MHNAHTILSRRRWLRCISVALLGSLVAACGETQEPPLPMPSATALPPLPPIATLFPTISSSTQIAPAAPQPPDSGWLPGSAGIELRRLNLPADRSRPAAKLIITRCDPAAVRVRVGYAPEQPRPLAAWVAEYQPLLAVNGGFFTPEYRATALVISDGVAHGASYQGFGGMLAVDTAGRVSVRSLSMEPYDSGEPLQQAVQSFPMLVVDGAPTALAEDADRARRTVVAQDQAGRLLLIVCSTSSFTLPELAAWLASSDLNIAQALNLDGGRSTGLFLDAGALHERIEPFDVLPMVLLVDAAV